MDITYDPAKNEANIAKHSVSFELVGGFQWDSAVEVEDTRYAYGESRIQALGYIGERLYMLVYTLRDDVCRIISLRKANSREEARYAKT